MKVVLASVLVPLLLLVALAPMSAPAAHYAPEAGDAFHYSEEWTLGSGVGNYSEYSEYSFINGSVTVTGIAANGTDAAAYSNDDTWGNVTGAYYAWTSSGTFTFSSTTFRYVDGTDNQTGYVDPSVWFYMNNSLPVGGALTLLNTACSVVSTNVSFALAGSPTGYVRTIETVGNGSFDRDDIYGAFAATYTWTSYFDPSTGYIVGYDYVEHDVNGPNGFTITDTLAVTSTTYALTQVSGPSASSGGSSLSEGLLVGLVILVVVVVIVIVAILAARSRRTRLPQHSAGGNLGFGPAPPPMGAPPSVRLTPSDQPAVQQIVIRETVKVPCRYCGTLIDSTATVCPNCGAPRT